jgi:hypothetical protein
MYVAAQRMRNRKPIMAMPCDECRKIVKKCKYVIYRDPNEDWMMMGVPYEG